VFSKDNDTLYLDLDGDSTLNSDDYAFILTDLDSFHGADLDFYLTSGNNADTITTLDGDDSISSANGNDVITSGAGNDTIVGGTGTHSVTAGAGNDSITTTTGADTILAGAGNDTIVPGLGVDIVTAGTGDDVIDGDGVVVTANRIEVTDFEDAGSTVGDVLKLATEGSTDGTSAGAQPEFETVTVTAVNANATYDLATAATATTSTADVFELIVPDEDRGNLETDFDTNGDATELFKMLSSAGTAASLTVDVKTDKFFIIAYDNGAAYIYANTAATDAVAQLKASIVPVFKLDGVTSGALDATDFLMV